MNKNQIASQIQKLREELHEHNYRYYNLDNPMISDIQFDAKLKELINLEKRYPEYFDPHSPTQKVGGEITKKFPTIIHKYPMYSLDNAFSKKELLDWEKRILRKDPASSSLEYICELKYDGASLSLFYENGKFTQAITRGDGSQGDDITANVRTIKSIPFFLRGDFPKSLFLRAEIILPLEPFKKINQDRIEKGLIPYANPRNTTSGTLKLQDSKEVAKRPLECLIYEVKIENENFDTHYESLEKARQWGFKVPFTYKVVGSMQEIFIFIDYWEKEKKKLAFEIDGIVIKVNSHNKQISLGYTSKAPRWAIAYKFPSNRTVSRLKSVSFQVGRTGAITPVAIIEPILLSGSLIKKASLHNQDNIKKLDLHQNDEVFVEKAGEIIPQIVGVDSTTRIAGAKKIEFITNCPACNTPLTRMEGESAYYCLGKKKCAPQVIGALVHFISRKAMDISGIGKESVALFYKKGLISDVADLYDLKKEDLISMERMGEKSAFNVIEGIKKSLQIPYERVLYALGITHVGHTTAKILAKHFPSIEILMAAKEEELKEINEIGEKLSKSLRLFFSQDQNQLLISRLKEKGLCFSYDANNEPKKGIFSGKSFLFSGKLENFTREQAAQKIKDLGGSLANSVNKNLDFLIIGQSPGSKLKKAKEIQSIEILTEEEFIEKIKI